MWQHCMYTSVKSLTVKYMYNVGCRDDTVPETVGIIRHHKVGVRACNKTSATPKNQDVGTVAENCFMLSTLPCGTYSFWARCHAYTLLDVTLAPLRYRHGQ